MSDGFDIILGEFISSVQDLATRTCALVRDVLPTVVEGPWPKRRVIGYGVGPRKMSEHFCCIAVHADHVNLGVHYGADLPDPEGLLEGPGKLLRHTKIAAPEDLARPALRALLDTASTQRMPTTPSPSA